MTLSLTYDGVLSRVRISGTGLTVTDSFTRTVANGWGTSDSGHAWTTSGGAAADYSVTGGRGRHSMNTQNVARFSTAGGGIADVDITALVFPSVTSLTQPVDAGVVARYVDASNHYLLRCRFDTAGTVDLDLFAIGSGGPALATASNVSTYTPGASLFMRFQVIGSTLRGKAWFGTEPTTWQVEATSSFLASGAVGFRSNVITGNTNTSPVIVEYDLVSAIPWVEVERSTNQVVWTTVRGGQAVVPVAGAISLDDYEFTDAVTNHYRAVGQTANITPVLDGVWLKSLARPFLNRKVTVTDWSDVERQSRSGVFPIVGRSFPIAVTDLHGSRQWTLDVAAQTAQEAKDLDLLISTGEVQFIHVPATERVPGGYVALGDTSERRPARRSTRRVFSLPLTECAAPGPDVIPAIGTCQTVLNVYATCSAVLAAHPTCADLLQLVGSPADVIV